MSKKLTPHIYYHLFFSLLIISYLSACSDADSNFDAGQPLITLNPAVISYITPDHWVYATDADGNLLDVKKTIGHRRLILNSTRPVDKFNLTIVSACVDTNGKTFLNIETYADIDRGSTFEEEFGVGFTLKDPGSVAFKLSSYHGPQTGVWFTNPGYYADYQETITGSTFNANILMYGLPSDVLLTTYRSGVPVYAKIKGVKGGDQIELDINNNFSPFEHQRKLNFDGYANSGNITAAYRDNTGKLSSIYFSLLDTYRLQGSEDATDQPLIGYVDGFDIYQMSVLNAQTAGSVNYFKQGDLGSSFESFTMPTFNFNVSNIYLPTFAYEFSEDFTYYSATFKYEIDKTSMEWTINAPQGTHIKIADVPAEIISAYPMLRPEALAYTGCTLTKVVSGDNYKSSVLRRQRDLAAEFEYYVFYPNR